jgi:large subunit ribosomal protein L10
MKTKAQKQEELVRAEELLKGSKFLAFAEFSGIPAEEVRKLRRSAKELGASILVIKKRLLSLLLKQKGIDFDLRKFKTSVGTVFSPDVEKGSGAVYKFLSNLGETKDEKAENVKKILGGYDLVKNDTLDAGKVIAIGQLPPREVIIGQLMGMLVAPLRTFMYIISEKAKQAGVPKSEAPKEEPKAEAPAEQPPTEEQKAEAAPESNPNPETPAESNPEQAS